MKLHIGIKYKAKEKKKEKGREKKATMPPSLSPISSSS
jgi:hypothetical protein